MGVDFYNCHICNEIYADCADHDWCEHCDASWCGNCMEDGSNEKFTYHGEERCSLCAPTGKAREPTPEELLSFILERHQLDLAEEVRAIQETPGFRRAIEYYECGECALSDVDCNPDCQRLSEEINGIRGRCCKAIHEEDKDGWCSSCLKRTKSSGDNE